MTAGGGSAVNGTSGGRTQVPAWSAMTEPRVGVVVIGRNEGERLVACLASLAPLGLPVVYVDSGSTDGSRDAARRAGAAVVELDLDRPFTAARARNEGAALLRAAYPALSYIQFVDGDCTVAPHWVSTARDFLDVRQEIAVVAGRRRERFPEQSIYNAMCDHEWNTPVGPALACGGDALVRASAFWSIGGFDPYMVAHEEPEMCTRLRAAGGQIERIAGEMTLHDANITRFGQWWRRNRRGGFGYAQAFARHPGATADARTLLRRALCWSALLPVAAALMIWGLWQPAVGLLLLYPLQVVRLSARTRRAGLQQPWVAAALAVTSKVPEALGAIQFGANAMLGRQRGAIFYK